MEPTAAQLELARLLLPFPDDPIESIANIAKALAREHEKGRLSALEALLSDDHSLEVARSAIEDTLIKFRNGRISFPGRGNGLVVREKDGRDSSMIRMSVGDALKLGLRAIIERKAKP